MFKQYQQKPVVVRFNNNIRKTMFVKLERILKKVGKYGPYELIMALGTGNLDESMKPIMFIPPTHLKMFLESCLAAPMDGIVYKIEYLGKKNFSNHENGSLYSKHTFIVSKCYVDLSPEGEQIWSIEEIKDPDERTKLDSPKTYSVKELSENIKSAEEVHEAIQTELTK